MKQLTTLVIAGTMVLSLSAPVLAVPTRKVKTAGTKAATNVTQGYSIKMVGKTLQFFLNGKLVKSVLTKDGKIILRKNEDGGLSIILRNAEGELKNFTLGGQKDIQLSGKFTDITVDKVLGKDFNVRLAKDSSAKNFTVEGEAKVDIAGSVTTLNSKNDKADINVTGSVKKAYATSRKSIKGADSKNVTVNDTGTSEKSSSVEEPWVPSPKEENNNNSSSDYNNNYNNNYSNSGTTDNATDAQKELAKITFTSVTIPVGTTNTQANAEAAILALANSTVASGYKVSIASGTYYNPSWKGKLKVINTSNPQDNAGDAAERVISVSVSAAGITPVTSSAFSLVIANNTVTITLTGGKFRAGTFSKSDFTFAGTDSASLKVGTFTRTSDTVVTITGITGLKGNDNTVTVHADAQATQATSVAAVASTVTAADPAGKLTVTSAAAGSAVGTTKVTIAEPLVSGNSRIYKVSAAEVTGVKKGDIVTPAGTAFTSGTTEIPVTANQYVTVYELDASSKVVSFVSRQITANEIKTADPAGKLTVTSAVPGKATGTTVVTIAEPLVSENPRFCRHSMSEATGVKKGDTPPQSALKAFENGVTEIDINENPWVTVYELDADGKILRFVSREIKDGETKTIPAVGTATAKEGEKTIVVTLTDGEFKGNGAATVANWTYDGTSSGGNPISSISVRTIYEATITLTNPITATDNYTLLPKKEALDVITTAPPSTAIAVTVITPVKSAAFTLKADDNTITVTLTGGTFRAGKFAASDFTFAGTGAAALENAAVTRTSNTVVTFTGVTPSAESTDMTVEVSAAAQATQATSVTAVASKTTAP